MDDDAMSSTFVTTNSSTAVYNATPEPFFGEPNRDPLYVVVPVTVIYVIIFLTGLVGNVSTCIVISKNKSMHTATNYYLFSLAISDLLLLITGLPQEIYSIWSKYPYVFGEVFCVLRGLAAETSANATVLTITAFTVERYVAICHPFLSHTMSKLSRAIKLILGVWLIALIFAIPQALQFGLLSHSGIVVCTQKRVLLEHSFEISTFLFFVTPMTLITVLYALIGLRLRSSDMMKRERSTRPLRTTTARANGNRRSTAQSSRRVLKMLVAVVVAFFICWAPFHAQRLVAIYGTSSNHQAISPTMMTIYAIMTYISGVLYYLSTTINPVLYHIMSNKFREAFKETLARCWGGGGRREYRELACARRHRPTPPPQDSTDYSGNSVREESLTSGGMQRYDVLRIPNRSRRTISGVSAPSDTCQTYLQYTTSLKTSDETFSGRNVTYKRDVPSSIRLNDKQTNTEMHSPINTIDASFGLTKYEDYPRKKRPRFWYAFNCVAVDSEKDGPYVFTAPSRTRLTVENETQTDSETFSMVPCNISNSSLRDVDRSALEDELTSYMEELHRRETQCRLSRVKA